MSTHKLRRLDSEIIHGVRDEERKRCVRILRAEAAAVEQLIQDWTVEEVARQLRDMADNIERGDDW